MRVGSTAPLRVALPVFQVSSVSVGVEQNEPAPVHTEWEHWEARVRRLKHDLDS